MATSTRVSSAKMSTLPASSALAALVAMTAAVQAEIVVQTGGGAGTTLLFERRTKRCLSIKPAVIASLCDAGTTYLDSCGAGDVYATALFRRLLDGASLDEACQRWAGPLAAAHLVATQFASAAEFSAWRAAHERCFPTAVEMSLVSTNQPAPASTRAGLRQQPAGTWR